MARRTVAEVLADAKKERDRLQKKALKITKQIPRVSKLPVIGAADLIATGLTELQNAVMDQVLDQAFADFQDVEIGGPQPSRPRREFDPNNPITKFLQDKLQFDTSQRIVPRPPKDPRPRTDPQLINDEIMRTELKTANGRARKKNGQFKKGWDQRRVMKMAQKECTKERERLGLCKRTSTRKGQRRKTARRAYER